ncbi:MAG TPA: rod shape-determining protein MreC [Solirubrobacterales bacterium]|nr:rod shape-determining protein MreC [Solirubrobacterales bacterium]
MYRKQVRRRRAVLVGLIVGSLILLSAHFSEAQSGPLHVIQRGAATVLSPLEAVANAALKPVRDGIDWVDETFEARGENEDLHEELAAVRGKLAEAQTATADNEEFRGLLGLDENELAGFGFKPVTARIVTRTPSLVNATVGINAGSADGVEANDAVVAADGLVGRVTDVTSTSAQVQLITDPRNGVSVKVAEAENEQGIVAATAGEPEILTLEFFSNDVEVSEGQFVVTAGWSDPTNGLSSAYPPGIAVGSIIEASAGDVDFQQVPVEPFVDMQELTYVQVLTGGPKRPGIDGEGALP